MLAFLITVIALVAGAYVALAGYQWYGLGISGQCRIAWMPILGYASKRKVLWALVIVIIAAAIYEFGPDGSSTVCIPAYTPARVRKQIARLRSRRPPRRCAAAFELSRSGSAASVPFLIALLNDEEDAMGPAERFMQSLSLGPLSRPVWSCAATALGQLGPLATPQLIQAFTNRDPKIRSRARHILSLNRDPESARFLSAYLRDADPRLRKDALIAVVQSGYAGKAQAVRDAFRDPDPELRVLALGYAAPDLGPWVYEALVNAAKDPDPRVRSRAADRLRFWPR